MRLTTILQAARKAEQLAYGASLSKNISLAEWSCLHNRAKRLFDELHIRLDILDDSNALQKALTFFDDMNNVD